MKYVRYKDLAPEYKKGVDEYAAKICHQPGYKHNDDYLVETCYKCGYPADLSECISDVPCECEGRLVTIRCRQCGRIYEYGA